MLDVNRIKRDFAHALRRGCSEKGCRLKLDGLDDHVVLKGDSICRDREMCDCIIFMAGRTVIIGIVELKSKTAHSSAVADKLTNSLEVALEILKRCSDSNVSFEFRHLLLHKGLDGTERRKMERQRIKVRGKGGKCDIITKPCGVPFSAVISGFKK